MRSRLSATSPESAAAAAPDTGPSPSPSADMPQSARLSSRSAGHAATIAVASFHDAPDLFMTSTERFGNGDGAGGGHAGHAALTPVSSRLTRLGNSRPNAATALQSLNRFPARSRISTRSDGRPQEDASPGSPAVWMAASGR